MILDPDTITVESIKTLRVALSTASQEAFGVLRDIERGMIEPAVACERLREIMDPIQISPAGMGGDLKCLPTTEKASKLPAGESIFYTDGELVWRVNVSGTLDVQGPNGVWRKSIYKFESELLNLINVRPCADPDA